MMLHRINHTTRFSTAPRPNAVRKFQQFYSRCKLVTRSTRSLPNCCFPFLFFALVIVHGLEHELLSGWNYGERLFD
jgi:hypothetical protein